MSIFGRDKNEDADRKPVFTPAPPEVDKRIKRGRRKIRETSAKRRLCQLFLSGDVYSYLDSGGALQMLATAPGVRNGKPAHRIRNRHNFIRPIVDAKVSSSTSRPPGYEVNPTGTDPKVVAGAHLAGKIATMGYETWYLREARITAAELAIGGGGRAYGLPYFDNMVGPFVQMQDEETGAVELVGEGEIKVMIFSGNEVGWEPGVEFFHSRWYFAETARPISEVQAMPDFIGGALGADAYTGDQPSDVPTVDSVLVTYYFERPCPDYPQGRMLTIANGRQILPESAYPLVKDGVVLDKPCLHELVYRNTDDDLGLTWELIDFQRTAQDCYNKIVELKNRALNLRLLAPVGSLPKGPPTDEPGGITYFNPVGGYRPEFEKAPDPNILQHLMAILERTLNDMRYVAADADIQAAPNVAANALQAVSQQAASRWSQFIGNLARWDADIASHCLLLAQEHYTEQRVLKVRGRYGWEPEAQFKGVDIMGQIDVRVNPSTIETQSRTAILQQLAWIQANFPGYLRPEVAIDIVMTGTSPESVIERFEHDKARANLIIQNIRTGTVMDMGWSQHTDPMTGENMDVPAWMPREFDDVEIQLWVLESWLKTDDFARLSEDLQAVAMLVYQGMKSIEAQQQAQAAMAQTAQAEELGATNAAKPQPQEGKPMPSTPNPAAEEAPE